MNIDIYLDWVIVNGTKVERPIRVGRSAWMIWWEKAKDIQLKSAGYDD